jgi:very-short-patch-repair endonuclease
MGLKLNYLPHAHYDRGGTRTNPTEAKAVAEAVIRHAQSQPALSLGVATFSVAQRQAVLNELELLRRTHPDAEEFFSKETNEPFFVKNLENIQGDERDVIFISVGYGKSQSGYMAMSFGPLNSDGGERRLNVLISRAKLRCEVFSSITGDDIDLERARTKGVAALKMFLTFAQTGKLGIAEPTGKNPESVFEEQVMQTLLNLGFDVKPQIGVAGFFVDLAISDPERPGRFVLGIECDGMQYHSSRSARDRDRLRQNVLEDHGWIIHRIWSTDWYLRPDEEIRKVQAAYESARSIWRERDDELSIPKRAVPLQFTSEREGTTDIVVGTVAPSEEPLAQPYVETELKVRNGRDPHEVPIADMAKYIVQIVETEGPIHENEIVVRIRDAWGLGRAGNRIREAVQSAINVARRRGDIAGGPFYVIPGRPAIVRDRTNVKSAGLRKPENLPPTEVQAAMLALIDANYGAQREELVVATARLFGFLSTSSQLRGAIDAVIDDMLQRSVLSLEGAQLIRCVSK